MKYRRKIFSAADVASIKDGRKTMFREMVVPQPFEDPRWGLSWAPRGIANNKPIYCDRNVNFNPITKAMMEVGAPLGTIGDRIWIPEAHQFLRETCSYECEEYDLFEWEHDLYGSPKDHLLAKCPRGGHRAVIGYADEEDMEDLEMRPSTTMPRWACRTFAEIAAVRVERVQDITEEDAIKEAPDLFLKAPGLCTEDPRMYLLKDGAWKSAFRDLWQSIYGNWDANPWVWVYGFRRIKP